MTRVLLLSTYELGEQPLGCASPAALLEAAGHDVRQRDLSVEDWPASDIEWAEAVACSVPMHTALRLGLDVLERLRTEHRRLPVAFHGLYAGVAATTGALHAGDLAAAGDVDDALRTWVDELDAGDRGEPGPTDRQDGGEGGVTVAVTLGRRAREPGELLVPSRAGLPPLERYARLLAGSEERLVGAVESTQGCNHTCRHCPVPVVYRGRSRPVELAAILADIDQLIAAGAGHIHFADPDFLNRPRHGLSVVRALHDKYPQVTFDATIKVSHILRYADLFDELSTLGLAFVISAFESTSDTVLAHLDKGHLASDEEQAVTILRAVGVEIRPSLLPFTPWTVREDLCELLDFVARNDLIWNVDPVQFGVRLLIPPGSLLLEVDDLGLRSAITGYDAAELGYGWRAADPLLDELQQLIAMRTEQAANEDEDVEATYLAIRALVYQSLAMPDPGVPAPLVRGIAGPLRPRLSESWFCCSEPTLAQRAQIGSACAASNDGC